MKFQKQMREPSTYSLGRAHHGTQLKCLLSHQNNTASVNAGKKELRALNIATTAHYMTKIERFTALGWQILEHKCRYYILIAPIIDDYNYDMLEKEYDALANELNLPKSASDMVDFDMNRPSCQTVYHKLTYKPKKSGRKRKHAD
jgi:hypothetical protein